MALTSPLPIIRPEDVRPFLQSDPSEASLSLILEKGLSSLVENFEKQVLNKALGRTEGDVDKAAALLQISRSNFYKKMKDYSIEVK